MLLSQVRDMLTLAPHCTKLLVDDKIKWTHENFIEKLTKKVRSAKPSEKSKMQMEPFPKAYYFAFFANLVYDKVDPKKDYDRLMPKGWCFLTAATNCERGNQYFGAAYYNDEMQQVVIAHRGTDLTNPGALNANRHIIANTYSSQMNTAMTFAHIIQKQLDIVNEKFHTKLQLSFTGHSLGAYLAEVTTFSTKYLTQCTCSTKQVHFVRKTDDRKPLHPHAVVFECPGCWNMMEKIIKDLDVRHKSEISVEGLDITSYLSAPNWFNSAKVHVGEILRLKVDFSSMSSLNKNTGLYNVAVHRMEKILAAFDVKTGEAFSTESVVDWPCLGSELRSFFKRGNHSNSYNPKVGDKGICPIRYQVNAFDGSWGLRIFSAAERSFLYKFKFLRDAEVKLAVLEEFLMKLGFSTVNKFIPLFDINEEAKHVTCSCRDNLQNLIKNTKLVMRWYPSEIDEVLMRQSDVVRSNWKTIYKEQSRIYLKSLSVDEMDFERSEETENFLLSDDRILVLKTKGQEKLQMLRVHSKMKKGNVEAFFLNWDQLLHLDQCLDVQTIVNKDTVLVISYPTQTQDYDGTYLKKIVDKSSWKIVFLTTKDSGLTKHLSKFLEKDCQFIEFKDMTLETQLKILKKEVEINGQLTTVQKLFLTNLNGDSQTLDELLDAEMLEQLALYSGPLILNNNLSDLSDLEVTHVQLYERTDIKHFLNVLLDPFSRGKLRFAVICDNLNDVKELLLKQANGHNREQLLVAIGEYLDGVARHEQLEKFKMMCKKFPGITIYLIEIDDDVSWHRVYGDNFYIKRHFLCRKLVDKIQITTTFSEQNNLPDLLIFTNVANLSELGTLLNCPKEKIPVSNVTVSPKGPEFNLIQQPTTTYDRPVHIIRKEEDSLVWVCSINSLDNIRKIIDYDLESITSEDKFVSETDKVVIIADEPGMGKSTSLTSLCKELNSSLTIRMNLREHWEEINNLTNKSLTLETTVDFLTADMNPSDFEKMLIRLGLEGKLSAPLYLLLDGFDEINELMSDTSDNKSQRKVAQENVLKLLKFIKDKTEAKVWVTTRKYPQNTLENHLNTFASKFQKVTKDEQIYFLMNFWLSNPQLVLHQGLPKSRDQLKKFVEQLFVEAEVNLGNEITDFIGIPLQLRMLAEVFQPTSLPPTEKEHVKNVLDLYRKFIKIKYDIYLRNKAGLSDQLNNTLKSWIINSADKLHMKVGFQLIFPDFYQDFFEDGFDAGEEDELNKIGLVQTNSAQVEFIHRTFAEYFTAEFILQWLQSFKHKRLYPELCQLLISKVFLDPKYKVVRLFLDQILQKVQLRQEANESLGNEIKNLCFEKRDCLYDTEKRTVLHLLVNEGLETTLKWILGIHPVIINFVISRDVNWQTPIALAFEKGNDGLKEICCSYISGRSDVDKQRIIMSFLCLGYKSPILDKFKGFVCENSNFEDIWEIFKDLNKKFETASQFLSAAQNGDVNTMRKLLTNMDDHYAQHYLLHVGTDKQQTALHLSSSQGKEEVVDFLLKEGAKPDIPDRKQCTPLILAATSGHLEILKSLLTYSSDINAQDIVSMTSVAWAAKKGHLAIVQHLLSCNCDLTLADRNKINPFHHAAKNGHLEIAKLLLERGMDLNERDRFEMTAFSWACRTGHQKVVEWLLDEGSPIDQREAHGSTPLALSIKAHKWNVMELLLEKGANVNIPNYNGLTPLDVCLKTGKKDMCGRLEESGAITGVVFRERDTSLYTEL